MNNNYISFDNCKQVCNHKSLDFFGFSVTKESVFQIIYMRSNEIELANGNDFYGLIDEIV